MTNQELLRIRYIEALPQCFDENFKGGSNKEECENFCQRFFDVKLSQLCVSQLRLNNSDKKFHANCKMTFRSRVVEMQIPR